MSLTNCPKCGEEYIWVDGVSFSVALADGWIGTTKLPAECANPNCDELYWWYPRSGRITRRSK